MATGWTNSRAFTVSATDATSDIASIEYKINNDPPVQVAGTTTVTLPADGDYRVRHRALDNAGQATGWTEHEFSVDTVNPSNTSAAAPTTWQTSALSLALTGTDAASGFDHAEWRVDGGDAHTGTPALVETEGSQTLETRIVDKAGNASTWRSETIRVDTTKPVNTTAAVTTPWRKTNFTTTVTGTDATPGSGVTRIEYKLDNGAVTTTPSVSITAAGSHKLETRVVDVAGNASDWRIDTIGIDKTNPTLSVNCGGDAWRAAPAVLLGGRQRRRLRPAHADRLATAARPTPSPAAATPWTSTAPRPCSSAPSTAPATRRWPAPRSRSTARLRRRPSTARPVPARRTSARARVPTICPASTGMSWSVDGSAATPMSSGGTFVVAKGTVVVTAVDAAGNAGASVPVTLADRTPVKTPTHDETDSVTPRTTSEAVLLKRGGNASARLIGQLAISATPTRTTVDLRPLALGSGTFKVVAEGHHGQEVQDVHQDRQDQEGLHVADPGQGRRGRPRQGHADRHAQVRQALDHVRQRRRRARVAPGLTFPARLRQSAQSEARERHVL